MSENVDSKEQEYKGISKTVASLGQSFNDGVDGLAVGGAVGAVAGGISYAASSNVKEFIGRAATNVAESSGRIAGTGSKFTAAVLVGAILVAPVFAIVKSVTGLFRGAKKATAARAQFDEITTENRELKSKLSGIETAAEIVTGNQKSHVTDLENQRAKQAAQGTSVA